MLDYISYIYCVSAESCIIWKKLSLKHSVLIIKKQNWEIQCTRQAKGLHQNRPNESDLYQDAVHVQTSTYAETDREKTEG